MSIILRMTRGQIIERLERQLPLAEAWDAEVMKAHKVAEAAFLKEFRAACKEAARWDYETAKKKRFEPMNTSTDGWRSSAVNSPSCPRLMGPQIKEAIRVWSIAGRDGKAQLTLADSGRYQSTYRLVTWTPEPIDMSGGCT